MNRYFLSVQRPVAAIISLELKQQVGQGCEGCSTADNELPEIITLHLLFIFILIYAIYWEI